MRHHLIFANMKITNYKLSDHLIPHAPDFCEIIVFKITNDKASSDLCKLQIITLYDYLLSLIFAKFFPPKASFDL